MSRNKLHEAWKSMKGRCLNSKHKRYADYGGRGITISDEWLDFDNFLADMLPSYFERATLERIENSKGYSKGNCKWATYKEQARNRRNNIYVDYKGQSVLLCELCERLKMDFYVVRRRIVTNKWTVEKAVSEPLVKDVEIEYEGQSVSLRKLCQHFNIDYPNARQRILKAKWPMEKVISKGKNEAEVYSQFYKL